MKTKITIGLAALAALCNACGHDVPPQFPRTFVDESHDEWLETHCESRGLIETTGGEFNEAMRGAHANFAELVEYVKYIDPSKSPMTVKAFACSARPVWYAADDMERPKDI